MHASWPTSLLLGALALDLHAAPPLASPVRALPSPSGPLAVSALPGAPVEKWRWDGSIADPVHPSPDTTPVVVQLTDDDGDGVIDGRDSPDIAFLHTSFFTTPSSPTVLEAVDGVTGATLFAVSDPPFGQPGTTGVGAPLLAAGDLDGDGIVELVVTDGPQLIVYEHDGSFAWARPWLRPVDFRRPQLGIADLDQDGVPEIYNFDQVLSADGSLAWSGTGFPNSTVAFSHAVDLAPGVPGLELLAGSMLYSATGTVLWENLTVPMGATAVGDVDGDGDPEIALTAGRSLYLLDHLGNQLGPIVTLGVTPSTVRQSASEPTMADLDADGLAEVVVPAQDRLEAHEWDGTSLALAWAAPIEDMSCCSGATAFDFDDDGASEVVYRDERSWFVFDGRTGAVLHQLAFPSGTGVERPVVADIDGDCEAEILVSGIEAPWTASNMLVAYDVPGAAAARAIWNQHGYHVTNVEDAGSIPRFEEPAWIGGAGWHAQQVVPCFACSVEILSPLPGSSACPGSAVPVEVALASTGAAPAVAWTSSCPDAVFLPSPAELEPTVLLPVTCGVECALALTVGGVDGTCTASVTLRVEDTRPPVFVRADPLLDVSLWPPAHGYVVFSTAEHARALDSCGEAVVRAVRCASSEPEDVQGAPDDDGANGDGHFLEDCVLSADGDMFAVRAERLGACGAEAARVYEITFAAEDPCGNTSLGRGIVRVGHDRSDHVAVHARPPLPPHEPPPFAYLHATAYGDGCTR